MKTKTLTSAGTFVGDWGDAWTVFGSSGDDTIITGKESDLVWAGGGRDKVWGKLGNDTLFGEGGNDDLYGEEGNDVLSGGTGRDLLSGGDGKDKLYGDEETDWLYGGFGDDYLYGGAGDDWLQGSWGADTISGGGNNDTLYGDGDNDELWGNAGDDQLYGGTGSNRIDGGDGIDTIHMDEDFGSVINSGRVGLTPLTLAYHEEVPLARVDLQAGIANVVSSGGWNGVILVSNTVFNVENIVGNDNGQPLGSQIAPLGFGDELRGNASANKIFGLGGDDLLDGRAGNDELHGDLGNDVLVGGAGVDQLWGGQGVDRFVFDNGDSGGPRAQIVGNLITTPAWSPDVITDFERGSDQIDLRLIDANRNVDGDQAFSKIVSNFDGVAGEIRLVPIHGGVQVQGDINGDLLDDFQINVLGVWTLNASDFLF